MIYKIIGMVAGLITLGLAYGSGILAPAALLLCWCILLAGFMSGGAEQR